jgi:YD repeat-containing protein
VPSHPRKAGPGGRAIEVLCPGNTNGYDAGSRITKIGREGGKTIYYSYDNDDRLTGENWYNSGMQNVYAFAWSYDGGGNRYWQNRLGQQTYFSYNAANALTKSLPVGGTATYYSYDLNGNCTKIAAPSAQTTYFAYNSVNLMTQVTFRNGVTNSFSYDALNRRRALVDSNGPAYFMYDKDGLCQLVERNNTGSIRAEYTRGTSPVAGIGDMVAAKVNTATTAYYQYPNSDIGGNVRRIVNAAGAVTGSFEYNAFGEKLLNQPPPEGTRFRFSAPAWIVLNDDPDGLVLLSPARLYHVAAGRFTQRDHKSSLAGDYIYGLNRPTLLVDPTGRETPSGLSCACEPSDPVVDSAKLVLDHLKDELEKLAALEKQLHAPDVSQAVLNGAAKFLGVVKTGWGIYDLYDAINTMRKAANDVAKSARQLVYARKHCDGNAQAYCQDMCRNFFVGPDKAPIFGDPLTLMDLYFCVHTVCKEV